MTKTKVLVFSAKGRDSLSDEQSQWIENLANVSYISNLLPMTDDMLVQVCEQAEYIGLTRRTCKNFHSGIINRLPNLKGLSVYSTGIEWIDIEQLKTNNVALRYLADYSTQTVAEHAMALLLACSRRIHLSDRIARKDLPASISIRGWELHEKTMGIIGMGRIGYQVSKMAKAFGIQVIYYDPVPHNDSELQLCSFNDVLDQSDILMLTPSLDRDNPEIITSDVLTRMKRGAFIINPSRPNLVDNPSILNAIQENTIGGYAVDDYVFSAEELKLVESGRILQTGHSGWYSDEAMTRGTEMWVRNLGELITNK